MIEGFLLVLLARDFFFFIIIFYLQIPWKPLLIGTRKRNPVSSSLLFYHQAAKIPTKHNMLRAHHPSHEQ
jgi:hypothetical protein